MTKRDLLRAILVRDNIRAIMLYCCLPALVFFLISMAIMTASGFTILEVLRDPAQQTEQSPFLGFLSDIGSWLWISAAAICFARALSHEVAGQNTHKLLLKMVAWFSLVLAIDDFFMIHDEYIAEGLLIPLYAIFVIYLLVRFHRLIIQIDGAAFVLAGAFLASSVVVDAVQEVIPVPYPLSQMLEEGFKFLGAAAWVYFCYRLAAHREDGAGRAQGAG